MPASPNDVAVTNGFVVEVDELGEVAFFREAEGLSAEVEVVRHAEGGQNEFPHQFPGRTTWPNLVLRRGMIDDKLLNWMQASSGDGYAGNGNELTRRDVAVVVMHNGQKVRSFELSQAFPVRWSGPRLDARGTEPVMEELEIAHHGFKVR